MYVSFPWLQSPLKSNSQLGYNFANNPNYFTQAPDTLPLHTMAVQLIGKEQIHFLGELGEGCFGKVYKGKKFVFLVFFYKKIFYNYF